LIPALHRKASEWFEAKGFIPEAIKHALASKDWGFVNRLLDRYALPIIFPGYGSLVIEWCREIPKSYLEKAPDICIHYAWALVLTFREDYMDMVEEHLQIAERAIQRPDLPATAQVGEGGTSVPFKDWVIGHACAIRSQILLGHLFKNIDPQELISLSLKGLELLPEVEKTPRSICRINLAHAQTMQNDPVEAQKAFEDSLPSMLEAGNYLGAVAATFYMSRFAFYMVSVDHGEVVCRQWKKKFEDIVNASSAENQRVTQIPATRGLDVVQSMLLLERNQFEEAERLLVRTLELLGWGSWMEIFGFIELARLRHALGNDAGVREVLQRMRRLGPQHLACAEALEILFAVTQQPNNLQVRARAEAWTKEHSPDSSFPFSLGIGPYHRDAEYFCNHYWAQIQIALGQYREASAFILPALAIARERGLLYRIAELAILQALIHNGQGNLSAALDALGETLKISEPRGYIRLFDVGTELDKLLKHAAEKTVHAKYAKQVMASIQSIRGGKKITGAIANTDKKQLGSIDPLSERELEVLRLLAQGLAPAEVAKKLFLSPFTLKAHTQNIYTKLDVHSRIGAINKARELGLF
jgi:LuxR family maltose regulon positive regulatory protein